MLALVATIVWIPVLLAHRLATVFGQTAAPTSSLVQAEREAVMAATEQFVLRLDTYGPTARRQGQMPAYRDRVSEVITPKFAASSTRASRSPSRA